VCGYHQCTLAFAVPGAGPGAKADSPGIFSPGTGAVEVMPDSVTTSLFEAHELTKKNNAKSNSPRHPAAFMTYQA
jgi:hypothetical protein